jgi:hypothetical protein
MILVNTPSFIATTLETQTPMKLDKLVVNYSTMLGEKDGAPQGYINSYIGTDANTFVYSLPAIEMETLAGDILKELHGIYIAHLSWLNPSLTFTSTL